MAVGFLFAVVELRPWHWLHNSVKRLKTLKCALEMGTFYGM